MSDDRGLVLEARGVVAGYGEVLALDDVTIGVPRGDVVAVLGPNGAGKSSLLSVLAGDLEPTQGSVQHEGRDITAVPAWRRARSGICSIPEGSGIFNELSVEENLRLEVSVVGLGGRDLADVYDLFPRLAERRTQLAGSMSGGEKQMLALSRAIATEPDVLLVDEPSLGLAPVIVDSVFEVLARLHSEKRLSIVIVEQYVERALELANWVVVLQKGRVRLATARADLPEGGELAAAYLGGVGADSGEGVEIERDAGTDAADGDAAAKATRRRRQPLRAAGGRGR